MFDTFETDVNFALSYVFLSPIKSLMIINSRTNLNIGLLGTIKSVREKKLFAHFGLCVCMYASPRACVYARVYIKRGKMGSYVKRINS